jgi:hypothetical protein
VTNNNHFQSNPVTSGANAHITATYLADRHPNMKLRVINFGAPGVGNEGFKVWTEGTLTNLSVWRYVYRSDAVPRALELHGFKHAGHLFMFYKRESEIFYHQVGDGSTYKGVPSTWICKFESMKP